MFGLIADLIASITTILLPAYLSYKSLRTHDPAQTHPWLIYFTILSLSLLFESWALFIVGWIPLYSWFRLFFLLYLVLPQTQGAKILYLDYLEPYIVEHETRIDTFISETHEKLQQMGLGYVNMAIEYIRDKILGQQSPQPPPQQQGATAGYASYAQDLLSRFSMPSARVGAPTTTQASAVYNTISGLAGAAISSSTGRSRDPTASPAIQEAASIPDSLVSDLRTTGTNAERSSIISAQRERLATILKALDSEQQSIDLAYGSGGGGAGHRRPSSSSGGLKVKSKSEQSFEKVDYDEADDHETTPSKSQDRRSTSGSWMPTGWFGGSAAPNNPSSSSPRNANTARQQDPDELHLDKNAGKSSRGWSAARDITEAMAQGTSSGVDRGR